MRSDNGQRDRALPHKKRKVLPAVNSESKLQIDNIKSLKYKLISS